MDLVEIAVETDHFPPAISTLSEMASPPYKNFPTPPSNECEPDLWGTNFIFSTIPMDPESSDPSSSFASDVFFAPDVETSGTSTDLPSLKIIEQPTPRFRFRYKSEMTGTHGALTGVSHSRTKKSAYPTVELTNYKNTKDPLVIRCSLWQINHKGPHAHRLIKKATNEQGQTPDPHDIILSGGNTIAEFKNMAIIHTAKRDIHTALVEKRTKLKECEVAELEHKKRNLKLLEKSEINELTKNEANNVDLNKVCLRFDAFCEKNDILYSICQPVYSDTILNLKSAETGELKICRIDRVTSLPEGGEEIFLLVERIKANNIHVRFFEVNEYDEEIWSGYGSFTPFTDVHHQYAIVLRCPAYKNMEIKKEVQVFIELERISDKEKSAPIKFRYIPHPETYVPASKKRRFSETTSTEPSTSTAEIYDEELYSLSPLFDAQLCQNILDDLEKEEGDFEFDLDTPTNEITKLEERLYSTSISNVPQARIIRNKELKMEDIRVFNEITSFLKTKPEQSRKIQIFKEYFQKASTTNALHVAIMNCNKIIIHFFIQFLISLNLFDIFNVRTKDRLETPLHIAVHCNNFNVVEVLIKKCKAKIDRVDIFGNTALHVALKRKVYFPIINVLLSVKNVEQFINTQNLDGDTPIFIAIKSNNFEAVKMLCEKGANIEHRHNKNGNTPLRCAVENIENENGPDIFAYLLQKSKNPLIPDFNGNNPLQVLLQKETENSYLWKIVMDYLQENSLMDSFKIKSEDLTDDFTHDTSMVNNDDLEEKYDVKTEFTADCLESICTILDKSENWANLADLLDLGHLVRSRTIDLEKSPSRQLLLYAISTNSATLKEIRDFLDNLDEKKIVDIMDQMVRDSF